VRIFPAVPTPWKEVSFEDLRAEGGFRVWAKREAGRTKRIEIVSTTDSRLRLRDPFERADNIDWRGADIQRDGADIVVTLRAGESLVGDRRD
jgi:alpha-L-fucosidase 2